MSHTNVFVFAVLVLALSAVVASILKVLSIRRRVKDFLDADDDTTDAGLGDYIQTDTVDEERLEKERLEREKLIPRYPLGGRKFVLGGMSRGPVLEQIIHPIWDTAVFDLNGSSQCTLLFNPGPNMPDGRPRRIGVDVSSDHFPLHLPCVFFPKYVDLVFLEARPDLVVDKILAVLVVQVLVGVKTYLHINGSLFRPLSDFEGKGAKGGYKHFRHPFTPVTIPPQQEVRAYVSLASSGLYSDPGIAWPISMRVVMRGTKGREIM